MWLLYSLPKETGKKNPIAVLKFNKPALGEGKVFAIFCKRSPWKEKESRPCEIC